MAVKWVWQSQHYSVAVAQIWCDTMNQVREERGYDPLKYKFEITGSNVEVYAEIEMV